MLNNCFNFTKCTVIKSKSENNGKNFETYGIKAVDPSDSKCIFTLSDISPNLALVKSIADKINNNNVSFLHIRDVIVDSLYDVYDF